MKRPRNLVYAVNERPPTAPMLVLGLQHAALSIVFLVYAAMVAKVARANAAGDKPGPAGSLGKLLASDNLVRIGNVASELLGSALVADTGE